MEIVWTLSGDVSRWAMTVLQTSVASGAVATYPLRLGCGGRAPRSNVPPAVFAKATSAFKLRPDQIEARAQPAHLRPAGCCNAR